MINCQQLPYDPVLQRERIQRVTPIFGKRVIERLLCFALYLFGVKRSLIASILAISPGSIRTTIRRFENRGLPAFVDGRNHRSQFRGVEIKPKKTSTFIVSRIVFTKEDNIIKVSTENSLQIKTILLTLLNNGLLDNQTVAQIIGISSQQVYNLSRSLQSNDTIALIDKRQGQKVDYKVTPEVKSELIQQFVADIMTRGQTSGRAISEEVKKRCNLSISERTVRHHVVSMGLARISKTLPKLVPSVKKNAATF